MISELKKYFAKPDSNQMINILNDREYFSQLIIKAKDLKFVKPDEGMELSYQEILNVYEKLSLPTNGKVYRGSTSYLKSLDNPIKSEASEMIIDLAKTGDKPLYILGIGCPTNIASAMITAPEIINDIVVLWTSAYPSVSPHYNGASLNLVQDPISSRLIPQFSLL